MMPKMEGGVLVEHSHRLAAGTVVILTLVLAAMLREPTDAALRPLRPFGWLAVGLVFVQALLGGITVLLRLPTPVSTAHTGDVAAVLPDDALHRGALARRRRDRIARAVPPPSVRAAGAGVGGRRVLPDGAGRPGAPFGRGARLHRRAALPRRAVARRAPDGADPGAAPADRVAVARAGARVVDRDAARGARARPGCARWRWSRRCWSPCRSRSACCAVTSFLDLATVESHLAVATALLATQVLIVAARGSDASCRGRVRLGWFATWSSLASRASRAGGDTFLGGAVAGARRAWRTGGRS